MTTGELEPAGLDAVTIKIHDDLLEDVDIRTVNWEWTMNDVPATCEFQIARNFDNFNETLAGTSFPLAIGDKIEIYFGSILKYYGEIISFDIASSEKTLVRGVDRKFKINSYLCSKDYGRHSIFDPENPSSEYQNTGQMLKYKPNNPQ